MLESVPKPPNPKFMPGQKVWYVMDFETIVKADVDGVYFRLYSCGFVSEQYDISFADPDEGFWRSAEFVLPEDLCLTEHDAYLRQLQKVMLQQTRYQQCLNDIDKKRTKIMERIKATEETK